MVGITETVARAASQAAWAFRTTVSASHPKALARRLRWFFNPPKSSFEGAENYLLALPRELRDRVYEYHINQLTFHYISNPVRNCVTNLDQTELHFLGHSFSGIGLDGSWSAFKEVRGLHPLFDGYDVQISPELEEVYLRTSTFHTAIKCAGNSKGVKDPLHKFLDSLSRDAARQICNLPLRILSYSPDSDLELICNPDPLSDPDFVTIVADERLDRRNEMRDCAARLAKVLRAYRFCGKIGLVGEYMDSLGTLFDVAVVKKGLEVADAAFQKGKEWKDVITEVLTGEEMDAFVKLPAEPTEAEEEPEEEWEDEPEDDREDEPVDEPVDNHIEWCFANVDFSKE